MRERQQCGAPLVLSGAELRCTRRAAAGEGTAAHLTTNAHPPIGSRDARPRGGFHLDQRSGAAGAERACAAEYGREVLPNEHVVRLLGRSTSKVKVSNSLIRSAGSCLPHQAPRAPRCAPSMGRYCSCLQSGSERRGYPGRASTPARRGAWKGRAARRSRRRCRSSTARRGSRRVPCPGWTTARNKLIWPSSPSTSKSGERD